MRNVQPFSAGDLHAIGNLTDDSGIQVVTAHRPSVFRRTFRRAAATAAAFGARQAAVYAARAIGRRLRDPIAGLGRDRFPYNRHNWGAGHIHDEV